MKKGRKNLSLFLIIIGIILSLMIVILADYIGSTDIKDYTSTAKFFAGKYNAKIRSSHSYFYGLLCSPFVRLTNNFIGMKIMSVVWLALIVFSIYYISKKDKKIFLLAITSPIFWYMAPWINPIQIASLFFLWGYYFIRRYDETEGNKVKNLLYSGLFIGLSLVFWDSVLFFGFFLGLCFLWNRKLSHSFLFLIFILIGLLPRLILDQLLFNFLFYGILRNFFGALKNLIFPGVSGGSGHTPINIINVLSLFIILPTFSFLFLKPKNFQKNKKTIIFLILSLSLILLNPQIRYTLLLIPIILINISKFLNKKQFKIQIIASIFISILVITPYLIQISYTTNSPELTSLIENTFGGKIKISTENQDKILLGDLGQIEKDFPNERFIVGNHADYYAVLANLYWGNKIKEFISIQDYKAWLNNNSIIFEKEFHPIPNIGNRRDIWIKGGMSVRKENYSLIRYAITNETEIDLNGFVLRKTYNMLNVFEKEG